MVALGWTAGMETTSSVDVAGASLPLLEFNIDVYCFDRADHHAFPHERRRCLKRQGNVICSAGQICRGICALFGTGYLLNRARRSVGRLDRGARDDFAN